MKTLLLLAMLGAPKPAVPLPGVTVTLSTGQTATTDAQGQYAFTVPYGWTGQITPSLAGYKFDPGYAYADRLSGDVVLDFKASEVKGKSKK